MSAVVQFRDAGKRYPCGWLGRPGPPAVAEVSLEVAAGEVFGLFGPNRAGKTTLVKMLLSLCRPTSGTVFRLGRPATDRRTLARVGYVHENHAFPRYLTARQLLEYYGALTLMPQPDVQRRAGRLLETVGLADRARDPIAAFSKGMVQRLALAQALLNEPDLLVLDEPCAGLDLLGQRLLRDVLVQQRRRGRSVLLVSHALGEVEQVCDRVGVLLRGRLRYLGPLADLTRDPATGAARPLAQSLAALYENPPDDAPRSPVCPPLADPRHVSAGAGQPAVLADARR